MPDTPGRLYLEHRAVVEAVIRFVCRRRGLRGGDAEDFAQDVRTRLVERGDEILARFQGRSSLHTYLTVVVQRLALDYQAARWGRWRPSMMARAAGAEAVRLEQLVVRDNVPLGEALTTIEREMGPIDRTKLEPLASRFPLRVRRDYVGEELLESAAMDAPDAEALLVSAAEADRFARVKARLDELLTGFEPADRLVLQLRFEQGLRVADIARLQHVDQKRLYRRIQDALTRLRELLEREGIDAGTVNTMLMSVESDEAGRTTGPDVRLFRRTRHEH